MKATRPGVMTMQPVYPLTVFYDGACGLCAAEMRHYRAIAGRQLRFVDIASDRFNPSRYGKTPEAFRKALHLRDGAGHFYTGVEAFRRLWQVLPPPLYPLLAVLIGLPGVNLAARFGYTLFARYRHLLPATRVSACPLPGTRRAKKKP